MGNLIKLILIFFVLINLPSVGQSQQVTKEQLLKLFFQAHTAKNANQTETAIEVYLEILMLSPGLPDPYLQLGDLYSAMEGDLQALEKACLCYENYMKLKPDAENSLALKSKISEMHNRIKDLKSVEETSAIAVVEKDTVKIAETKVATEIQVESPIKKDTLLLASVDSVESKSVLPDVALPIGDALLGRWVSADLGLGGREQWIFDVVQNGDNYYFVLNDSSYVRQSELKGLSLEKVMAFPEGNELVVTLLAERKRNTGGQDDSTQRTVLDNLLNVSLNLDLFSESTDSIDNDVPIDSAKNTEPIITDSYQFRLAYDGHKLGGFIEHKVVQKDTIETLLSCEKEVCELFKAPDDYSGFVYQPLITDAEKASDLSFRQLLNSKLQESKESASAANDLACMYASGVGVRRNLKMAVAYFMEASNKQNIFGLLNMAQLYVDGLGVEKDLEKARSLYKLVFEKGYSDAMVMCGDTYLISAMSDEDYKNAFDCYLNAVLRRCPYAYYRLGWLYKEGLGTQQDLQKALEYYQKAVDMQYPDALTEVGLLYINGIIVEADFQKGMDLLLKAAEKGNSRAMYELYLIFLRGDGVNPDFKYAKDWFHRSMLADDKVIDGFNMIKSQINKILSSKK